MAAAGENKQSTERDEIDFGLLSSCRLPLPTRLLLPSYHNCIILCIVGIASVNSIFSIE
jgi:hypothetical protein